MREDLRLKFNLSCFGQVRSTQHVILLRYLFTNAYVLRALRYSLACKCSLHLWSAIQIMVVPWWDEGHDGVFTHELDLLYVLLDSIAYVSLKADQPVTPSLQCFSTLVVWLLFPSIRSMVEMCGRWVSRRPISAQPTSRYPPMYPRLRILSSCAAIVANNYIAN